MFSSAAPLFFDFVWRGPLAQCDLLFPPLNETATTFDRGPLPSATVLFFAYPKQVLFLVFAGFKMFFGGASISFVLGISLCFSR